MKKSWAYAALVVLALAGTLSLAEAENGILTSPSAIAPAAVEPAAGGEDDGSIRITPDSTRILRLERDAASVIVANPAHASVVLDSPRLLIVMPRQPGTTLFTVLDAAGAVILEKNVIVTGTAKPSYVRIRRACSEDSGCVADSYYYCPDGCYEVSPVSGQAGTPQAPPLVSGANPGYDDTMLTPSTSAVPAAPDGSDRSLPPVLPPTEPGGGPQVQPMPRISE